MKWKETVSVSAGDVVERFGLFEKAWGKGCISRAGVGRNSVGDLKWCGKITVMLGKKMGEHLGC